MVQDNSSIIQGWTRPDAQTGQVKAGETRTQIINVKATSQQILRRAEKELEKLKELNQYR